MPLFTCSMEINARQSALFALTQDYSRRLEWAPYLREARLVGNAREAGVGVKAWCVARSGLGMETVYLSYKPPQTVAIQMTRGPWFLQRFAGSWEFEEVSPLQTRVTFRYNVLARPAWLRSIAHPLLKMVFARDMRQRLYALQKAAAQPTLMAPYTSQPENSEQRQEAQANAMRS